MSKAYGSGVGCGNRMGGVYGGGVGGRCVDGGIERCVDGMG